MPPKNLIFTLLYIVLLPSEARYVFITKPQLVEVGALYIKKGVLFGTPSFQLGYLDSNQE